MKRRVLLFLAISSLSGLSLLAAADPKPTAAARARVTHAELSVADGEQRYRANCSRCHQAPPKFARAAMGTLIRHMRVRAMITDEDMRAILKFMTQ